MAVHKAATYLARRAYSQKCDGVKLFWLKVIFFKRLKMCSINSIFTKYLKGYTVFERQEQGEESITRDST